MLAELRPQGMLETLLVTQMVGVHEAVLGFLRTSTNSALGEEIRDQIASRATRLMRLFNEQLDQLQRIRGAARQQRVTVEHVHVNAGGQAIVGVVGNNPHPKTLSSPDPPLFLTAPLAAGAFESGDAQSKHVATLGSKKRNEE